MSNSRLEEIRQARLAKLQKLRDLGIDPYPAKYSRAHISISSARDQVGQTVSVAGRLWRLREHGNVVFADLRDPAGQIQLLFQKKTLVDKFSLLKLLDVGDFLGVEGSVITTSAGEITVDVSYFEILGKSIRPLPDEWHGLKDVEERFRKRYLDLLLNPDVKKRFDVRTIVIRETRNYLDDLGFFEVETPMFHPLYGGANARPFTTHMHALDTDFYLRIAFELYLKRLVVGGYDKVYEIGRDFRNEGLDHSHNPEFTMIEWYEANADYHRVMDVTEGLFKHLAQKIYGTTAMQVDAATVEIGSSWPRIPMTDLIAKHLSINVQDLSQKELVDYCRKNAVEVLGGETSGQLIFDIFDKKVAKDLIEPTWVIDYPGDVSPLSKPHRTKPGFVERFEGYIGGREICDGWSELTDPAVQRARWEFDTQAVRRDKAEAQSVDEDFLEAMEYGLPPLGGIGIGMDRLTMFFTNTWSIKEVILFPTLRPESAQASTKSRQDFTQKLVVVINPDLPAWQVMNTSAHIAAFLGNKMSADFDTGKYFTTKDGANLPRNTQYPIVTLTASPSQLKHLMAEVRKTNLLYIGYVPEMMVTTDDKKLAGLLAAKDDFEIDYAGIGLFGPKNEVDALTQKYPLWGQEKNHD